MGSDVDPARLGAGAREAFRDRLRQSLAVLADMLAEHAGGAGSVFEAGEPQIGMEVELVLVHGGDGGDGGEGGEGAWSPARAGATVLGRLHDPDVVPEIGAHTLELNVPPSTAAGHGLAELETSLRARLTGADAHARSVGTRLLMIGILPTLLPEHLQGGWMTPSARYRALEDAVLAARGGDLSLDITEPAPSEPATTEPARRGARAERLSMTLPSIAAEAACTSTQLHLKTTPEAFAATWNAAQLLAGPQLALAANSPFALGRRLWPETRVPLFTQSIDTRTPALIAQGVHPRVFAGAGWTTGVLELFTQDVDWFDPLLPQLEEEDPAAVRAAGGVPALAELCLHSGTVWRWNRPVYAVSEPPGATPTAAEPPRAHLRVENRVLPSAPTVVDAVADAAVFYGAVRALVEVGPDPAPLLDPGAPAAAITACARAGLAARIDWPGRGRAGVASVLAQEVLPLAADGLARWGVPGALVDRYLGIAAARAATGRTGAAWQVAAVAAREAAGADRVSALTGMLADYSALQDAGDPVHTWPPG